MATFVLVHGAYLGPWSWNLVISSLNRRGHQAINIELPVADEALGASDYAQSISDQITAKEIKEDIVLVGHDLANLVIPLLSEQFLHDRFPLRRLIYLAPLIAYPGRSLESQLKKGNDNILLVDHLPDPTANRTDAFKYWLHDCDPDIASWASTRFSKQHYAKLISEVTPLKTIPETNTSVIICKNDRLINSSNLEQMSKSLLKIEALSIDSGHCPQLSRPQELALLLMQLGNSRSK
jgi:pimeloyl-ACP methyl ester carboxylesterase